MQNSGTSRKNNRTLDIGSSGMTAVNLLIDGGIEKSTRWLDFLFAAQTPVPLQELLSQTMRTEPSWYGWTKSLPFFQCDKQQLRRNLPQRIADRWEALHAVSLFFRQFYMNWNGGAKLELLVQNSSGTTLETHLLTDAKPNAAMEDGWQRVSATYTPAKSGTYRFLFKLSGCNGTAYLDDLQLEQAEAASTYNLLQNGSFENTLSGNWSINGMSKSSLTTTLKPFGASGIESDWKSECHPACKSDYYIELFFRHDLPALRLGIGEYAAPNSRAEYAWGQRYFGLIAEIFYTDTSTAETQSVPFEWSGQGLAMRSRNHRTQAQRQNGKKNHHLLRL
ncbi:MAG: hypothetical protein ACLRR6_04970 [Oscillospiraceae bacterium]